MRVELWKMLSRRMLAVAGGGVPVAVALALAAPVAGQVRLIPQIGVYSAVEDPGRVRGPSGLYEIGRYESTFAFGGAVEFAGNESLGFRVGALYASEAETAITGSGCPTGCPAGVDLLSLTGALVVRPLKDLLFVEPYLVAGGGLKRLDFEPDDFGDGVGQVFSDESEWAGILGVGAAVDLGGLSVGLEVADHFHWSDFGTAENGNRRMDDFFFTVGLVLGR